MGAWISDLSLKYKFWAVNAVAFVISLMLVLFGLMLVFRLLRRRFAIG